MAIVSNVTNGKYGIVNLRKVAGVRTGEVNIQYVLDATDFATKKCENGFLLVENHNKRTLDLPSAATDYVGLVASVEKQYEDGKALGDFALGLESYLPRIYTLKKNDKFDTNNFKYDDTVFADYTAIVDAVVAGTATYGYPSTDGQILITATQNTNASIELKASAGVFLPAGESGLIFVVTKA